MKVTPFAAPGAGGTSLNTNQDLLFELGSDFLVFLREGGMAGMGMGGRPVAGSVVVGVGFVGEEVDLAVGLVGVEVEDGGGGEETERWRGLGRGDRSGVVMAAKVACRPTMRSSVQGRTLWEVISMRPRSLVSFSE